MSVLEQEVAKWRQLADEAKAATAAAAERETQAEAANALLNSRVAELQAELDAARGELEAACEKAAALESRVAATRALSSHLP